jgi:hypothetical protein
VRWVALTGLLAACSADLAPDRAKRSGSNPSSPVELRRGAGVDRPIPPPPARIGRLTRQELDATARRWLDPLPADWPALPKEPTDTGFSTGMGRASVGESEAVALEKRARILAQAVAPPVCDAACIRQHGRRAFRRPLRPTEVEALSSMNLSGGPEAVFGALFQSPHFLFHVELPAGDGRLDDHARAAMLAYGLWAEPPDAVLAGAADRSELDPSSEVLRLQADPRYRAQLVRFAWEWLGLDRLAQAVRDPARHPDYSRARLADDARAWLGTWALQPSLQALLLGDWDLPEDGPRAGILTHPAFLAAFANAEATSPTRRGLAIMERLLCEELGAPLPGEVDMSLPPPAAGLTTRARFEAHATDPLCRSCHARFDPMGFALEGFDQVGRWRTEDNGVPIDASGALVTAKSETPVEGAVELATALAASPSAQRCLVRQVFRWFVRRDPRPIEAPLLDAWANQVAEGAGIDALVAQMMTHPLQGARSP